MMLDSFSGNLLTDEEHPIHSRLFHSGPFERVDIGEVQKFFELEANRNEPFFGGQIQLQIEHPKPNLSSWKSRFSFRADDFDDYEHNYQNFSHQQFLIGKFSVQHEVNQRLIEFFDRLFYFALLKIQIFCCSFKNDILAAINPKTDTGHTVANLQMQTR